MMLSVLWLVVTLVAQATAGSRILMQEERGLFSGGTHRINECAFHELEYLKLDHI